MSKRKEVKTIELIEEKKDPEVTEALARAFARFYVDEGSNALKAALKIWPSKEDLNLALRMSAVLEKHELVLAEIKKAEENALTTLPTKAQFAQKLWALIDTADTDEARVKFMKLYADARGFIEKPVEPVNSQNVTVVLPRCIEIPHHGSDEEWEQQLARQQKELMKRAKGRT